MQLDKFSLAASRWHSGCTRLAKRHEYPAGCGLSTHAQESNRWVDFQMRNPLEPVSCRKIPISNNVGPVKRYVCTRPHALEEERHFALVVGLRFPTLGSLLIGGVRNSVRPSHLFDPKLRS